MATAIHTKFLAASGVRGARIKAYCKDGSSGFSVTIPYPHELPQDEKHVAAAKALAERLKWAAIWIVGHNADATVSCVALPRGIRPAHFAGHTLERHPLGYEGADWFQVIDERDGD